jgi:hypothetical protein
MQVYLPKNLGTLKKVIILEEESQWSSISWLEGISEMSTTIRIFIVDLGLPTKAQAENQLPLNLKKLY